MKKNTKKRAAELCDAVALLAQCMASNPYVVIEEILELLIQPELHAACDYTFWWCWNNVPRETYTYSGVELCGEIECRIRECALLEGYTWPV